MTMTHESPQLAICLNPVDIEDGGQPHGRAVKREGGDGVRHGVRGGEGGWRKIKGATKGRESTSCLKSRSRSEFALFFSTLVV